MSLMSEEFVAKMGLFYWFALCKIGINFENTQININYKLFLKIIKFNQVQFSNCQNKE